MHWLKCESLQTFSNFHVQSHLCICRFQEAIMMSNIQYFEADFLRKVSLKILKSGLIVKTFIIHVSVGVI